MSGHERNLRRTGPGWLFYALGPVLAVYATLALLWTPPPDVVFPRTVAGGRWGLVTTADPGIRALLNELDTLQVGERLSGDLYVEEWEGRGDAWWRFRSPTWSRLISVRVQRNVKQPDGTWKGAEQKFTLPAGERTDVGLIVWNLWQVSALVAAGLSVLMFVAGVVAVVRRRRADSRMAQGLCIVCGYRLVAGECPECGPSGGTC